MALDINIPIPTSEKLSVQYWRIARITIEPRASITAEMHGYWTADDRSAQLPPALSRSVSLPISEAQGAPAPAVAHYDPVAGAAPDAADTSGSAHAIAAVPRFDPSQADQITAALYGIVKMVPDFAGAVDC